jgi:hypothetical protein
MKYLNLHNLGKNPFSFGGLTWNRTKVTKLIKITNINQVTPNKSNDATNCLVGLANGLHTKNSASFTWKRDNDCIELFAKIILDGKVTETYLCRLEFNNWYYYDIQISNGFYKFNVKNLKQKLVYDYKYIHSRELFPLGYTMKPTCNYKDVVLKNSRIFMQDYTNFQI